VISRHADLICACLSIGQVAHRQAVSLLEHHPVLKNENDEIAEATSQQRSRLPFRSRPDRRG
jgi:hypothetical protein